jgi:hypothetical protein
MTTQSLQEALLLAFECVESERNATYISGPITTGRRFIHWYSSRGYHLDPDSAEYREAMIEHVVRPNEEDLLRLVKQTRQSSKTVVIEPTHLKLQSWSQAEFHHFWEEVLERFCRRMIVVDGWQYSAGCAVEFRHAILLGLPVKDVQGQEITASSGAALLIAAAGEVKSLENLRSNDSLRILGRVLDGSARPK